AGAVQPGLGRPAAELDRPGVRLRHLPPLRVPPPDARVAAPGDQARRATGGPRLRPRPGEEYRLGAEPRPGRAGGGREGDRRGRVREGGRGEGPAEGELPDRVHPAGGRAEVTSTLANLGA